MSRMFGIAGVQMQVIPYDADATVEKMRMAVTGIGRMFPWVQMVLFHELVVPGIASFASYDGKPRPKTRVEPIPGLLTDALCEIARQEERWLVPGSMLELDGDNIYNTAIVISPEGKIAARYRKIFPWYPYEDGISPGNELCVFDVPQVGRFGICICYDMWFPEVARNLAWMGAEVILHPTLTPTSDRPQETVLCQATAILNQCYFIDVNAVSPFGGGRSMFVDPDGRVLQQAGEHDVILTEALDLDRVTLARQKGTLCLSQTWKQFRDTEIDFPMYHPDKKAGGEIFKGLGPLQYQKNLSE